MIRNCIFCDNQVREVQKEDRQVGPNPGQRFVHMKPPNSCRQFLTEDQTYTEGESDLQPPSEPQY